MARFLLGDIWDYTCAKKQASVSGIIRTRGRAPEGDRTESGPEIHLDSEGEEKTARYWLKSFASFGQEGFAVQTLDTRKRCSGSGEIECQSARHSQVASVKLEWARGDTRSETISKDLRRRV